MIFKSFTTFRNIFMDIQESLSMFWAAKGQAGSAAVHAPLMSVSRRSNQTCMQKSCKKEKSSTSEAIQILQC